MKLNNDVLKDARAAGEEDVRPNATTLKNPATTRFGSQTGVLESLLNAKVPISDPEPIPGTRNPKRRRR